jgi:neurofibromin 1
MKAYVIDVIRLKDVDDVIAGTGLMSEHLMIKHSQTETVTFISKSESQRSVRQSLTIPREK